MYLKINTKTVLTFKIKLFLHINIAKQWITIIVTIGVFFKKISRRRTAYRLIHHRFNTIPYMLVTPSSNQLSANNPTNCSSLDHRFTFMYNLYYMCAL